MKTIQIKIRPNGEIEAETKGIKGKLCLKYIAEIERMANAAVIDSDFTDEYYETAETNAAISEQEVLI